VRARARERERVCVCEREKDEATNLKHILFSNMTGKERLTADGKPKGDVGELCELSCNAADLNGKLTRGAEHQHAGLRCR
jgi:hypothetical protein